MGCRMQMRQPFVLKGVNMKSSIWKRCIVLILALIFPVLSVSASEGCHSWYCKRNGNSTPPSCPPEMSFITNHKGFYINENAREDDKVIYLTFDIGYENGNTESILNTLKAHDAKGAFFVLEHVVKTKTDLIKRMAEEGHLICNHTATHKNMAKVKDSIKFQKELERLETVYAEYTGNELARFYRPPEGSFSEANLKWAEEMGYATVFWSLAYADWDNNKQPDAEKSLQLLLSNTHNGMILLLHPTSKTNAEIMDRLLTAWEEMGYRFGSLEELTKAR